MSVGSTRALAAGRFAGSVWMGAGDLLACWRPLLLAAVSAAVAILPPFARSLAAPVGAADAFGLAAIVGGATPVLAPAFGPAAAAGIRPGARPISVAGRAGAPGHGDIDRLFTTAFANAVAWSPDPHRLRPRYRARGLDICRDRGRGRALSLTARGRQTRWALLGYDASMIGLSLLAMVQALEVQVTSFGAYACVYLASTPFVGFFPSSLIIAMTVALLRYRL